MAANALDLQRLVDLRRAELEHPNEDSYVKALRDYLMEASRWGQRTVFEISPMARTLADLVIHLDAAFLAVEQRIEAIEKNGKESWDEWLQRHEAGSDEEAADRVVLPQDVVTKPVRVRHRRHTKKKRGKPAVMPPEAEKES